ncbi:hypothetical protein [Asanoa iriomotensis]|uniref:DUF983 domain-containing protein n=1 Tax=Asanoa iriomotensis TaxID=234613 RepID=A0ABQ4C7P7_9ACTN|nr:hypothetical protein [Asanoa iriomotensis]GIF58345.1 hypothetical protein Air01nite_44400 [Asanoa iriomotensis]
MTAPDDTRWTVRVVWEPRWRALARRFGGWRRRRKKRDIDAGDVVDSAMRIDDAATSGSGGGNGDGFDLGDAVIVVVVVFLAVIVAAALFWWVLLPLLLIVVDLMIVLVLLVATIAGRVLFRRPWTVEATAANGEKVVTEVVGWRAALRRRDEIAESLRRGQRPVEVLSPAR